MSNKKKFLYVNYPAEKLTPIDVLERLSGSKKFLLESTIQHEKKGKYSFLGMNPYGEVIGQKEETIVKDFKTAKIEIRKEHALHYLKDNLPSIDIDLPLPFYGGAVGYISYDVARQFEGIGSDELPDPLGMPDIHFMLYEDLIVFDHTKNEIYLVAINLTDQTTKDLQERIDRLRKTCMLKHNERNYDFENIYFQSDTTEEEFKEKVMTAKCSIEKGELQQVVISQRLSAEIDSHPAFPYTFYQQLRQANPSPYMFYIDFEEYLILGASPESLVQTTGREVATNPIAGTRPRGNTPNQDRLYKEELLADRKERNEHEMLVDLSMQDLERVCETDSVSVPTYMAVEKYQHVMHIVSEVKGKIKKGLSSVEVLLSCLPAGTVSGAPRRKAMQLIHQLENKKRGAYGGGIGYINFNHDLNIALTIRSLVVKDFIAHIQAGAGIVSDSIPQKEYEETINKAKSITEVEIRNEEISAESHS